MPLTEKGSEILNNMVSQYGEKKGEQVFNASKNAGTIKGVDAGYDERQMGGVSAEGVKIASATMDPNATIVDARPAIDIGGLPMGQTTEETLSRNFNLWPVNDKEPAPEPPVKDGEWLVKGSRGSQPAERKIEASNYNEAILKASKTPPIMLPKEARLLEDPVSARAKAQAAYQSLKR